MIITGRQAVDTFPGRIPPDFATAIIRKHAAVAPVVAAISTLGGTELARQEEIKWATDSLVSNRTQINRPADDYDAATVSIDVDDAKVFVPNDLLYAEATNEVMFVSAVNTAANTLTVQRGIGSTVAAVASVADNAFLKKIGQAAGEGGPVPEARKTQPGELVTYLQHFKTPIDRTGRAERTETITEDEGARLRAKAFEEHMRDINHAVLFGIAQKDVVDAAGRRVTTMGGLIPASTTYATAIDGAMTKDAFNEAVREPLINSRGGRVQAICGPTFLAAHHTLAENKLQTVQGDSSFGLAVTEVITPYGIVELMPDFLAMSGDRAGDAIVLPLNSLRIRALRRNAGQQGAEPGANDTGFSGTNALMTPHLRENVQLPGYDVQTDVWESEIAVSGWDPACMSSITGVSGAA